jgi:rubrerythrin
MGSKLLPMTLAELCVHALLLEEGLGSRYSEYARLTRDMGAHDVADAFKEMERLEEQESKALKAGVHGRKLPELSPWEYVWRLTYAPDALESVPRVQPHDVREALQLALAAEHRAESFYSDTATHARDAMVRSCAAELAQIKNHRLRQLEHLISRQKRIDWFGLRTREIAPAAPAGRFSKQ